MNKIYITGISGTGKTTIAEELKKLGYHTISIDETAGLCSWRNRNTDERITGHVELNKEFTDTHKWICDMELLKEHMGTDSEIVFVLGMASNRDEIASLFDKVLLLQCKPEIFLHRLNTRTNNSFGKDESIQNDMLEWYESFENKMLKNGAISVNTDRSIDEVVDDVINKAKFVD